MTEPVEQSAGFFAVSIADLISLETRNSKLETRNSKLETRNSKLETKKNPVT